MKRRGIAAAVIASCLIIASVSAAALFYTGILKPVNPCKELYPVRGVDVSSYQGKIDWNVIASQGISFAAVAMSVPGGRSTGSTSASMQADCAEWWASRRISSRPPGRT